MKKYMFMIFMILMTGIFATTIYIPEDYATIQEGIDASEDGDEIIVSPGIYVENIDFAGKAVILGSLFYTTQDTSYISQTIIDGDQDGSVVTFESEEDFTSALTGFTITNGHADYGGGIYCSSSSPSLVNVTITGNSTELYGRGGGIYCYSSSLSLENVTITGNSAEGYGGGIYCYWNSSPSLENVTISNNSASDGGGIYCYWSNPGLENVTITNNSVDYSGGGIYCHNNSSPSLENVTITNNSAVYGGGGIYCSSSSSPSLMNVTIAGNSVDYDGGGIHCASFSSPSLVNVTITNNSAVDDGGGIYCYISSNPSLENVTISNNSAVYGGGISCTNSSPSLVNCILWSNSPQGVEFSSLYDPNTITIAYSDIDGGEEGIETNNNGTVNWLDGNIDADPLFVDAANGNYLLTEDSPCVDTGIAYFEYEGEVLVDLSADEYWGIAPDMGAYEYGLVNTDEVIIQNSKLNIQNYPNPFNPETNIVFDMSNDSNVLIEIYNIKGQKVTTLVNGTFKAGSHKVTWNARDQSSGIYLLRFNTAEKSEMKKLILLK